MIGSFGLGLTCVFLLPVIYLRYRFIDHKLPEDGTTNLLSFFLGCLCSIGVMGVGAVQVHNCLWLHFVFADLTFFGFTCYLLFQTYYLDSALKKADPFYKRGWWRIVTSVIPPISLIVMLARHPG